MQVIRSLVAACVLASAIHAAPANGAAPPRGTPGDQPSLSWNSLTDQKLIFLHLGDNDAVKVKKSQLASLHGDCDIAVQVREAKRQQGRVKLLLENIGAPATGRCRRSFSTVALEISGFKDDESPELLAASVGEILKTPEQYLAGQGIAFNLAPGPEDEQPTKSREQFSPPKLLLMINGEFSDEARRSKYSGTVMLGFVVGTDGRAHQARVLRGGEMGLGQAALRVLPLWRFEPARQAGKPVASQTQIEMSFNLY